MAKVYTLEHIAYPNEKGENIKRIGIFSSLEKASSARQVIQEKEGFRDFPNSFFIDHVEIDSISWEEGFSGAESDRKRYDILD